jgi:hypothetical protein
MRRCGRTTCLIGAGLLVAILMAGGALAAPGGNGKGRGGNGSHPGQGLALAKGHEKHAPATPQLTPPPAAKPAPTPAPKPKLDATAPRAEPAAQAHTANASPPGASTRHNHVTICHATGSGRYIVISPNVNGVMNGHLKHHDDFVYTGSCSRGPGDVSGSPPEDPPPATHPPRDPPAADPPPPARRPSGNLPFTGVSALYLALIGSGLLGAGLFLRRSSALPQDDEGIDGSRV